MAEPAEFELSTYLPYLINRIGFTIAEAFAAEHLKPEGLTIYMWRVLAVLANTGPQRQVDLSDMTSIDAPTLSRLVGRMVHDGLVTRRRSETSNREVVVSLTTTGVAAVQRLIPTARALEKKVTTGLSSKEVATVKQLLARIYGNVAATD